VIRSQGWLATQIDDDLLMMHEQSDAYLNLNGVGARIWQMLEDAYRVDEICRKLVQEYRIEAATAGPQVLAFLSQLHAQRAINVLPVSPR
jgi:hypothetical protein